MSRQVARALNLSGLATSRTSETSAFEGFWCIFKRGIVGSFRKVSAKYMPLYVAEFQFRYNNRENADIFGAAISGC
jgi:ISXO2-like transposase domain